ncbi:alanine--tRNA ligase [Oligella ureolytica]
MLNQTPFYAESGGQVGDSGILSGFGTQFSVEDTQKILPHVFGHYGVVSLGTLKVGDEINAQINIEQRQKTIRNHSVTHIMHKALRETLGGHVQQKGSLVDADKTRFDFSHDAPMTAEQIIQVEAIVNQEILNNTAVQTAHMSFDEAVAGGAMALFGEKYEDEVRVLDIGTSRELCGGTHVERTGDIGMFKIVSEGGIAAGIRRVEGITGTNALTWVNGLNQQLHQAAAILKASPADLVERVKSTQEHVRSLEKEVSQLKAKLASVASSDLSSEVVLIDGVQVLVKAVEGVEAKELRGMIDLCTSAGSTGGGYVLWRPSSDCDLHRMCLYYYPH